MVSMQTFRASRLTTQSFVIRAKGAGSKVR